MKIEFYEEFPNKENLSNLNLLKFPTKIFIAAKSIEEFEKWEKVALSYKKDLEVAYWPIVKNSYWISPFANRRDLVELFEGLNKIKNPLLIDLELPLGKKWKMYLTNLFSFRKNKKLIREFMKKNEKRITTAEYIRTIYSKMTRFLGLTYKIDNEKSLMWYSSMIPESNSKVKKNLKKIMKKEYYSISLGTIAIGIMGNEPILSPEKLEEDLIFVKEAGFKKVVVFRLEGLNEKYLEVLNKFTN